MEVEYFVMWLLVVALLIDECNALSRNDPSVDGLVVKYWKQHKKYAVILAVSCGMTWLKRKIKSLGLARRCTLVTYTPIRDVKELLYRSTFMMLLKVLDPEGSSLRGRHRLRRRLYQNKGPNFVWHLDGYDKLKPYGFSIHACIDGYSRKIIWLKVGTTIKDPKVILLYYLLSVYVAQGVPTIIIRSDCGTENASLATCHMLLRHQHSDEFSKEKSYCYGSSATNTRIESWWAQLRKSV